MSLLNGVLGGVERYDLIGMRITAPDMQFFSLRGANKKPIRVEPDASLLLTAGPDGGRATLRFRFKSGEAHLYSNQSWDMDELPREMLDTQEGDSYYIVGVRITYSKAVQTAFSIFRDEAMERGFLEPQASLRRP